MAARLDGETDKRLRRTSVAWNYFTLIDDERRIAACNTCDSHMSFRSSISNLMKHLKRKHGGIYEARMSDDDKDTDSEAEEAADSSKINSASENDEELPSSILEHFEITSAEKKIATCSICQVPLSYKSSVQVLLKHLRKKHNIGDDEVLSEEEGRKSASPPPNYRSAIWPYFRVADPARKTARCLVCRKLLSFRQAGTSNLRKHLTRKHPLIKLPAPGEERKTIILSSGDQLYEYEVETGKDDKEDNVDMDDGAEEEPIAIDEVFLDEFNGSLNRVESDKKYKSKKRKHKRKESVLEQPSDSDEEVLLKNKINKKEDSIDLFAKYIASLLKELPKQVSNRLQKEFVQQIMNAQNEPPDTHQIMIAQVQQKNNTHIINAQAEQSRDTQTMNAQNEPPDAHQIMIAQFQQKSNTQIMNAQMEQSHNSHPAYSITIAESVEKSVPQDVSYQVIATKNEENK